jgi:hypothetical protein
MMKKGRFREELERAFNVTPKNDMEILLGDFNAKAWTEYFFRIEVNRNSSLHELNNDNRARIANFAMSSYLVLKSSVISHPRFHKHILTFPYWKKNN